MKKVMRFVIALALIITLTMALLTVTHSMYVEWTEIYIIIGSISAISIIYNLFIEKESTYGHIIISSVFIGFTFSYILSLIDLVVDHPFVTRGIPDGRFLTLGETIAEFTDDLHIVSLIVMFSVLIISSVFTGICLKFVRKRI